MSINCNKHLKIWLILFNQYVKCLLQWRGQVSLLWQGLNVKNEPQLDLYSKPRLIRIFVKTGGTNDF